MNLAQRVLIKLGIEAKVKGSRAWAPCPFHEERSGSFFVRISGDTVGLWHCFGCKEGGTLAELVAKRRDTSVELAEEWLAKLRAGEEVDDEVAGQQVDHVRLVVDSVSHRSFALPKEVKLGELREWVTPAAEYARARHLTDDQVRRWGLGYATVGRLVGRIVLPVRDASRAPRSYMARTFAGHEARYYYPAEREHADLDVVFGEQHWPDGSRRIRTVIVCEGALNVLAVERAIDGDVEVSLAALGGSSPRPMHVAKLSTFGRVIVMTDDDEAGEGAAWELDRQLGRHTEVVRVSLGEGRDADDVEAEELRDALWEHVQQ